MARAKRTARAEARRRHRAEQGIVDTDLDTGAASSDGAARPRSTSRGAAAPPARIGIAAAFRQSFRPVDIRGDIAALPFIATRTKALWVPVLLTIASTIAFVVTGGADIVTRFLFAYFVQTPAIGGVFIAGFLAPRASWLLGLIVGIVSAICYSILILTVASAVSDASTFSGLARDTIISAFLLSPGMGILFASAAAWYRRFLYLSNPNRGRQAQGKPRRGADGRSRSGGSQNAGARR